MSCLGKDLLRTMYADLDLVRKLTHGAVAVTEKDGWFLFSRFTDEQRDTYRNIPDFYRKTFASSGIRLEFKTSSSFFAMDYHVTGASSRKFYYFDVFVNGILVKHEGSESCEEQPDSTLQVELPQGIKTIAVYFPCLVAVKLNRLLFDDASVIQPLRKSGKMICFGDSITQGYDARHSFLTYPNQLADAFDAEMINKGIGGEVFRPDLLANADPMQPDLLTIAYGTNDWSGNFSREELRRHTDLFCRRLVESYPDVPVFAILPLWRSDFGCIRNAGTFEDAGKIYRSIYEKYSIIRIIDGFSLIPHDTSLFSDGYLHPNDSGFSQMSKNLIRQIQ